MTVLEPVVAWLMKSKVKVVTLGQVMAGADRPRKPVLRVMDRLVSEGYLEETEDNPIPCRPGEFGQSRRNPTWKVLKKPLSVPNKKAARLTIRDRIWKLARAKRRFTVGDIERLTGAGNATVRLYLKMLEGAGYVRKTGKDERQDVWMLIRGHNQVERPAIKEKGDE